MRTEAPLATSEHHVELFDSSRSLADTVSEFLLAGFQRGEPLMIAATPQHRELLIKRLHAGGVKVRTAIAAQRLVICDAAETLDKFMRRDGPNAAAFEEVIGTMVRQLSKGKRVCIYGEMVDVLAERGQIKAAQQLEHMWNDLGRRESFTLFCGYASGHFGEPKNARVLGRICAAHDHVHRKREDLLAEFLLNQLDSAKSSAD